MPTSPCDFAFPFLKNKEILARFDGGEITSDTGILFIAQADRKLNLTERLAAQIIDERQPGKVLHSLQDLLRERIYALAAGYEDANDLNSLATDPALLLACGKRPTQREALASQPTISRLENSVDRKDLFCMSVELAQIVIEQLPSNTKCVILDVDASEDACHGQQEFEHFNGYYDTHCYLPLLLHITAEDGRQRLLCAMLRPGNASSTVGLFGLLSRAIALLRIRFPQITITLRADGGFGHAAVLSFCEDYQLIYDLGLPSNQRLRRLSAGLEAEVQAKSQATGQEERLYTEFWYQADTWEQERRVVCKAEQLPDKLNVRYVVHNRPTGTAEATYAFYCQRGNQENRIKEMKLDLFCDRTSCERFLANQLRLLFSAAASILFSVVQEALMGTAWAGLQIGTLRLRLIKVGARVITSCRRIWLHLPTSCPSQALWKHLHAIMFATPT
jgi:hypothetical protein